VTDTNRKLSVEELDEDDVRGRRVIVRVDYNVPIDSGGKVTDDTRIRATLPTIRLLGGMGARLVLLAHFGRPKGKRDPEMSLRPVASRVEELLGRPVRFVETTTGPGAVEAVEALRDGEVLLLENTRFDSREEANDPTLAEELADLGELYVNDAFGAAHRAHASTAGVAEVVRSRGGLAVAGLLMKRELEYLGQALEDPARPFVGVLGGAKISGKIDVIEALLPRTDRLVIGGAMANTFLRAQGLETGSSLVEEDRLTLAAELLERAGERLVLPVDVVIARRVEAGTETRTVAHDAIPSDWMALDIGPESVQLFASVLREARTILWNGPMGVAEIPEFRRGTEGVARALVEATDAGATTVVGGGDSAAALAELGFEARVSHVSTGGGASLEFLEGRTLPGVDLLTPARGAGG
jgi:phosphoglycerate kinase